MYTNFHGWTGKLLRVDLTERTTAPLHPALDTYRAFIGGKGLAGHFFRPACTRDWNDPAMPLLFMTGPLNGTIAPTSGRCAVLSRSPLTGTVGDASVGGRLATELKRAGWDGIVVTGQSDSLLGLEIVDDVVQLREVAYLAGVTTSSVFDTVSMHAPKGSSIACVGPAAENGSPLAAIITDRHHAAGRGGLGLIMASKGLKYVTVKGTGRTRVFDPAMLKEAREDILRLTAASPVLMGKHGFSCRGTASIFDLMDSRNMMPTDNFSKTRFAQAGQLNAAAYAERFHPVKHGCSGCHILCKKVSADGRTMPEFETMSHFTALIGNTDMALVMAANQLCNDLGLDTISAGSTLACLREITGRDFTPERLLISLEEMGAGGTLGQGASALAEACGRPELAMTVKGLELPAYDPRGAYGMALAYATSTRGGCHLRAYPISHEILRKPVATDRFSFSGKARIVKIAEDMNAVVDSLTACKFTFFAASLEEYAKVFTAVTGLETSGQELLQAGERIYYHERIMNAANGFTAEDDDLPDRFFTEPGTSGGGVEIKPIDREAFLAARQAYYTVRGLGEKGQPLREKYHDLGLEP